MATDKQRKRNVDPDAPPASIKHRADATERSPGERQHPRGEERGKSVLQQQAGQHARAKESQRSQGDALQNVDRSESKPPLAQEDGPAGVPFQPRGRYRKL